MNNVYSTEDFKSSEPVDVTNYFTEYRSCIKSLNSDIKFDSATEKDINTETFKLMNVSLKPKERSLLSENCSINHLTIPEEPKILDIPHYIQQSRLYVPEKIPEGADSLQTIINLKKLLKYNTETNATNNRYIVSLKYRSEIKVDNKPSSEETDINEGDEIVFHVRLYHPFRYIKCFRQHHFPRFSQEVILLGSNTLADLRDKILCASDVATSIDISQNPIEDNEEELFLAKERYPSGFLYIDGTFYNDFRTPSCIDYSKNIIEWAKKSPGIGPFNTAVMENTYLKDLTVRLGYPQIYQHQGNCEHIFVFSDIRLITQKDSLCSEDYPMFSSVSGRNSKYCMMCGDIVARWIVTDCDRLPSFPTYLCENCFHSYLYKDDEKLGNFKAYRFYDKSSVM